MESRLQKPLREKLTPGLMVTAQDRGRLLLRQVQLYTCLCHQAIVV